MKVALTEAELDAYFACTDCGIDTREVGEFDYQIRPSVWEIAYPGYKDGLGVGSCRPCISCLQLRVGRLLSGADFSKFPINDPDPRWHGPRLLATLRREPRNR